MKLMQLKRKAFENLAGAWAYYYNGDMQTRLFASPASRKARELLAEIARDYDRHANLADIYNGELNALHRTRNLGAEYT